jgi:para-nitrobenzyl esterase
MRFNVEHIEDAEKRGSILAEKLGDGSLSSLRAIPFSKLVQPDYDASIAITGKTCSPVVDGVIIPRAQSDMLLTSEGNPVPMIMGSNRDEGLLPGSDLAAYQALLNSYGNYSDIIKAAYPASDDESAKKALSLIGPEQWFARVSRWAAFREETLRMPTWHYQFCHPSSFRGKIVGAIHSCEIPYVFDTLYDFRKILPIDVLDGDSVIASTMSTYWANFIKYLNPNGDGVPEWRNKGTAPHEHMRIDAVTGMETDLYNERMQYQLKSMDRIFGE